MFNRVVLLDIELNHWTDAAIRDNEFNGIDWYISRKVCEQPWYDWSQEYKLELYIDSHYSYLTDSSTYSIVSDMLPELKTYWTLTWGYTHIKY